MAFPWPALPATASHYQRPAGAEAVGASECHAGQYDPAGGAACADAGPGYYVPADHAVSEIPAGVGHYAQGFGNVSQSTCVAGTYQTALAQDHCIAANPGYFVPAAGAAAQFACRAGSYQPSPGQSSCLLAAKGYYVPTIGATAQLACPNFQTTTAVGSTACRVMSDAERLAALRSYVTGKGPGRSLRRLAASAHAALVIHDLPNVRRDLKLLKATARAESGRSLTPTEMKEVVREANAILTWRVPILGYHWTVCPDDTVPIASRYLYVCPDTFRDELQLLIDNGWTFITAADFAADFRAGTRPAPKTAVITIDGTEAGDYEVAFPILAELGIRATFFISPGLLGGPGKQTWLTVEAMAKAGQDIENHGMFHKSLINLHGAALAAEIKDASNAIEAHLGYRPSVFCYANGAFDGEVESAVSVTRGMGIAVYTHPLPAEDPAHPFQMQRLSVRGEYTPADLLAMLAPYISG